MNESHWVPKELRVLSNPSRVYWGQDAPPNEFPGLREKLKSDIRMWEAWRELSNRSRKDGHLWVIDFLDCVCASALGPRGLASLTRREATERLDKIIAASRDIRRECVALALDLPIDLICGDDNHALGNKLTDALDNALRVLDLRQRHRAQGKGANRGREPEHYRACREAWEEVEDYFGEMAYQDITALSLQVGNPPRRS